MGKRTAALVLVMLLGGLWDTGAASAEDRVSRPGEYSGYSPVLYDGYKMTSQYVSMRDGTRIAVDIIRPTQHGVIVGTKLPVVWMNTPYNRRASNGGGMTAQDYPGAALWLVQYGYVVAIADMRGTGASFGKALHDNRNEWTPWAYWDAYDVTEWLARQPWSDSKVGMWGCSATGHSQWQAAATAPPHLKAIFPMSAPSEYYDWNGVTQIMDQPPALGPYPGSIPKQDARAAAVDGDAGDQLLNAAKEEHRWNLDYGYAPFRDSLSPEAVERLGWKNFKPWIEVNTFTHFGEINKAGIPAYETANFGEDERVKLGVFVKLANVKSPTKLTFASGNHCNWTSPYKENPANTFNASVEELRWFDYWLKGVQNGIMDEPPIYYYTYNEPKEKSWKFAWQWPLPTEHSVNYYFGPREQGTPAGGPVNGSLSTTAAKGPNLKDQYTVNYDITTDELDQKGLTYTTAALNAATTVTGHPIVHLWISSTATDGDFIAYLADVAPDGKVTVLPGTDDGRMRASLRALNTPPYNNLGLPYHRAFAEDSKPLKAGEPVEMVFDLAPVSWVFQPGHRMRLIVACTAAAHHKNDPSPTTKLSPPPVVTFYRDGAHASYVALPVNGPIEATAKLIGGKAGTVEVEFPKTVDHRYIADIKTGSITCNGQPASSAKISGEVLMVECNQSTVDSNSTALIRGAFGSKYDYGDLMSFTANLPLARR